MTAQTRKSVRIGAVRIAIITDSFLLGLGLFGPCLTIHPGYGGFDALVALVSPGSTDPKSLSIAGSISVLFQEGQLFIGTVLLVFSVLFPIWKLGVLWTSTERISAGSAFDRELRWVELLGKFSMLDILVLALLVIAIKGLPGGTRVAMDWGSYCFFGSVLASLFVPFLLRRAGTSGERKTTSFT